MILSSCSGDTPGFDREPVTKNNFRRLLLTFESLSDLGREMTAVREFPETARIMLASLCEAMSAREGALFTYSDRPSMLTSVSHLGFAAFPEVVFIPLLPKHAHTLASTRGAVGVEAGNYELYLSSDGNIAPELFRCLAPLRAGGKLVGLAALGRRTDDAEYDPDELEAMATLTNYMALAVQNHVLSQALETRIAENLRLLGSLHTFYDNALEAFAAAIDIKEPAIHGHSLRVGRYSAAVAESMGMDLPVVAGIKAAGYLHDVGMVAVDRHIWQKPSPLDPAEFQEMADHTVVGHRILSGIEFPWPKVGEVVRSHHERADGSGYPDHLRMSEIGQPARIVAVCDTFDAMTSLRPYRRPLQVGEALSELVRLTPQKFDPVPVHGLLVQVRRDSTGTNKVPFLDRNLVCNISPTDIDNLASLVQYKLTNGRTYHT